MRIDAWEVVSRCVVLGAEWRKGLCEARSGKRLFECRGRGRGGVHTVVGGRGQGGEVAVGAVRAHGKHVGVGPFIQGELPVTVPVRNIQPTQVGAGLGLVLRHAVRKHILIGVLTAELEALTRGGGGERRSGGGGGGLEVADQPVPFTHQPQVTLGKVVSEHVPAVRVWVSVCE